MKKFSWILALILALSIGFIGCPAADDDDGGGGGGGGGGPSGGGGVLGVLDGVSVYAVEFGTGKTLIRRQKGDETQAGTLTYLNDGSGYKYEYDASSGYQNTILRFPIKFAEDVYLSDYSKVTFTWKADGKTYSDEEVSDEQKNDNGNFKQDVNSNKKLMLFASSTAANFVPQTTWTNEKPLYGYAISKDLSAYTGNIYDVADDPTGAAPSVNGVQPQNVELRIDPTLTDALTGEVYVAIYVHVQNSGGSYTISNVKFVPKTVDSTVNATVAGPNAPEYVKPKVGGQPFDFTIKEDQLKNWLTKGHQLNGNSATVPNYTPDTNNPDDPANGIFNGTVDAGYGYDETTQKLKVKFTLNEQRINIGLTDDQITALKGRARDNISFEIVASVSGGADSWRYCIGSAAAGSAWNGTEMTVDSIANLNSKSTVINANFDKTDDDNDRTGYFILQARNFTADVTIEITSIRIYSTPVKAVFTDSGTDNVTAVGGATVSDITATSYKVNQTGSYADGFAYFKVTLASGTKLSDYKGVTLSYTLTNTTVADEGNYKNVKIFAFAKAPTAITENDDAIIASTSNYGSGTAGTANTDKQLDVAVTKDADNDVNEVYIVVHFWSDAVSYTISNFSLR